MKLITLNTWGGRGGIDELLSFFKKNNEVDIFCLQEIWHGGEEMVGKIAGGVPLDGVDTALLAKISEKLPDHQIIFHPHFRDYYGLVILVKKSFQICSEGDLYVYKEKGFEHDVDVGNHARNIQYVELEASGKKVTIINFHGLWNGQGKTDTDDRLLQSTNINNFLATISTPFILAGDFNLRPETKSIEILEEKGLRNLIKEFGVASTRTKLYTKEEPYADYVLVNAGIQVSEFKVLNDVVSDHAPLFVEFSTN